MRRIVATVRGHRANVPRALSLQALDRIGLGSAARRLVHGARRLRQPGLARRNRALLRRGGPDGLPLPPPRLVHLVTGQHSLQAFHDSGAVGAGWIRDLLATHGVRLADAGTVLDFGCGCGRILRHLRGLGPSLAGVDVNPLLVDWCRDALPFATVERVAPDGRLPQADGSVDVAYAVSILTHLTEARQRHWMAELTRVLAPGGALILTVHGQTRLGELTPAERRRFDGGQIVIRGAVHDGANACATYHPEAALRRLAGPLDLVALLPGGALDARQDAVLMRAPGGPR